MVCVPKKAQMFISPRMKPRNYENFLGKPQSPSSVPLQIKRFLSNDVFSVSWIMAKKRVVPESRL